MKRSLILAILLTMTSLFAAEVETECLAMNENREKIIKPTNDSSKSKSTTVQQ